MSDKETAPQELQLPEAWTTEALEETVIKESLPKAERLRRARARTYEEALARYSHELLPDEERMILLDRIKRLRKSLQSGGPLSRERCSHSPIGPGQSLSWALPLIYNSVDHARLGGWMRRVKLLVLAALLAAAMLATSAVPASAQGYTGWIEHPYPSAGYWWCEYSGSAYWCQDEWGNWFPANPDWYDASYNEMMRIYGQGVL